MQQLSSLLLALFLSLSVSLCIADPSAVPAKARVEPVTDLYFGEAVVDRYRWMENDKDADWLPFLKSQNAHTRSVLDELPGRAALLQRIQQLSGDVVATSLVRRRGGRIFFQQRPTGANNFKLFVRAAGRDRLLIDPTKMETASSHISLDWWEPSPDGNLLAYGLSKNGSEDSTLRIMRVSTGEILPERIGNTQVANPQWLGDSSGFFYNQLTGKVNTPDRYLDSRARFHRIGSPSAADPIIMARGLVAGVEFEKIQAPNIVMGRRSKHVLLMLSDVRSELRLLIAPLGQVLAGKAHWQPVAEFADEVTDVDLDGDALYLLANKGHPRGRLLQISASSPNLSTARLAVAESALVLQGMARAKDGLYLRSMDGGIGRLQRLGKDGRLTEVGLPFEGTLGLVEATSDQPGALLIVSGWLNPTGVWVVDSGGKVSDTGLTPKPSIDTSPYTTERRFATAKDGTKIPYSLIYKKGLARDGSNSTFLSAYGSYGLAAYTPAFAGRTLALIDQGAIVGYANVRGGGEYGRDWHRAGQLENKPNTWRDLIAVSEDMIAAGYTAPTHLAIGGRSAGGVTVGRALTERPDLFAAVVSGVGWHNPLRYVAEQNGYAEEPEWGAIREKKGYLALKSIDSYQAVVDGTKYPAVLLTTGVTDPRVAPFHPAKMAARLQAATSSDKPVLLRVDFDAGHGMGSTRAQQDAEAADTFAFILSQTQLQPVKSSKDATPAGSRFAYAEEAHARTLRPRLLLFFE